MIFRKPDYGLLLNKIAAALRPEWTGIDRYRDFRAVFSTPQGMRVLAQILVWAGMWKGSFSITNPDPNLTAFHEGKRDIGLKIMMTMNKEPLEKQQQPEQGDPRDG